MPSNKIMGGEDFQHVFFSEIGTDKHVPCCPFVEVKNTFVAVRAGMGDLVGHWEG